MKVGVFEVINFEARDVAAALLHEDHREALHKAHGREVIRLGSGYGEQSMGT